MKTKLLNNESASWQVVWNEIRPWLTLRTIVGAIWMLIDVVVITRLIVSGSPW